MIKRNIIIIMLIMAIALLFVTCGNDNNGTQVTKTNNKYVNVVYNGTFDDYPDATLGKAFDYFFYNPKWEYFKSDDGNDIVEFDGGAVLGDDDVLIEMQFEINGDRFEVVWFGVDGESESDYEMYDWIDVVFKEYYNSNNITTSENNNKNNSISSSDIDPNCMLYTTQVLINYYKYPVALCTYYEKEENKHDFEGELTYLELKCDSYSDFKASLQYFYNSPKKASELIANSDILDKATKISNESLMSNSELVIKFKSAAGVMLGCLP